MKKKLLATVLTAALAFGAITGIQRQQQVRQQLPPRKQKRQKMAKLV